MKYIQYNCKLQAEPTCVSFWQFLFQSLTATLTPFGNTVQDGQLATQVLAEDQLTLFQPVIVTPYYVLHLPNQL